MTTLHATATVLTPTHVDVKTCGDRLDGRDVCLKLGDNLDLLDAPSTLWADRKGQRHILDPIYPLGDHPMGRGMPWLATRRFRILFGVAFGEGRGLALVAAAHLFYLAAQFRYGRLQLSDPSSQPSIFSF
jgi:hypothetical protein